VVQAWSTDVSASGTPGPVRRVEQDAADEGYSRFLTWALFWLPVVSVAGLLVGAVIYRPAYDKLLQEDFPVEWAQFACCLFVCVVALMSVRPALRSGQRLIAVLLALAGVGFFFLAGEEISWGQRVFGFATPGDFAGNHQDETNLHNFTTGFDPEAVFRSLQLVLSLVMLALGLYGRLGRARPGSFWRIVAPPLFTLPLLASLPAYRVYRLFVPGEVNFAVRLQEWAEFCQYVGLSVAVVGIYFALQPASEPVGESARHASRAGADRDWRRLRIPAAIILVLTLAFAVMTRFSGVTAGNAL